jgi:hypothetical protein
MASEIYPRDLRSTGHSQAGTGLAWELGDMESHSSAATHDLGCGWWTVAGVAISRASCDR